MAGEASAAFLRIMAIIKSDDFVKIPVGDKFAIVDAEDEALVKPCKWYLCRGYARSSIAGKRVSMHRLVMNAPAGSMIDHKDGDPLNNRKSNLRFCDNSKNQQNRKAVVGRSKFKGVRRDRGTWRASIRKGATRIDLGVFPTERLAAKAYDEAAVKWFGKFAKTNRQIGLF